MSEYEGERMPGSLDQTLVEIRSGRRLEKVASSIENFLLSQLTRLEKELDRCQHAVNNDAIVQRAKLELVNCKLQWEAERDAEVLRLHEASTQMVAGWKQLEDARRKWLDECNGSFAGDDK